MTDRVQGKNATGRLLARVLGGAAVGVAASALFFTLLPEPRAVLDDPEAMLAVVAGLTYWMMGLLVGLGALLPRSGAHFLNVEDADEIREQWRSLVASAAACMFIGLFLLILASTPGAAASAGRDLAALAAAACLVAVVGITFATRKRADEMTRQISLEASALTLHVALVVLAAWAALFHLGYAGWTGPVGLIAGLALSNLAAIIWVSGNKGLMKPR